MKNLTGIVFLSLLFFLNYGSVRSQSYSGGMGTELSPYLISTSMDLIYLSQHEEDWKFHFIQTEDIIFNEDPTLVDWDGDGTASNTGTDRLGLHPIGFASPFTGSYNAQNNKIQNLFISNSKYYIGLFGRIKNARIDSIQLANVRILGKEQVGGIAGSLSSSVINNCSVNGQIKGEGTIGGIAGISFSGSVITNCESIGIIEGTNTIGGIIGENNNSLISYCKSEGLIFGGSTCGGVAGINNDGATIENSFSSAEIHSRIRESEGIKDILGNSKGGFVGFNMGSSTIRNCFSTGSVTGKNYIGGFAGNNQGRSIIENSYTSSPVWGTENVGGFVGYNYYESTISKCYSTGFVKGMKNITGGFAGTNSSLALIVNCVYDIETSSLPDSGIGRDLNNQIISGLSSEDFNIQANFTDWSWGESVENPWKLNTNGRPYLFFQELIVSNNKANNLNLNGYVLEIASNLDSAGICFKPVQGLHWEYVFFKNEPGAIESEVIPPSNGAYIYRNCARDSDGKLYYGDAILIDSTPFIGEGNVDLPFQINSLEQLEFLSENIFYWNAHFLQTRDINASETQFWNIGDHDNSKSTDSVPMGFSSIGNSGIFIDGNYIGTKFTGTYDGGGHHISNLFINRPGYSYLGFFGLTEQATIRNLNLTNAIIKGKEYLGCIAGLISNTQLSNITAKGKILGANSLGSISGGSSNGSVIVNSTGSAFLSGKGNIGGITGINSSESQIESCHANGITIGESYVGGIAGENDFATISNCIASGGEISLQFSVGGITGVNENSANITNCYSSGNIHGPKRTDAITAYNYTNAKITNCYFDSVTCGQVSSGYGQALNTAEFQNSAEFHLWEWGDSPSKPWQQNNIGRPYLYWQKAVSTIVSINENLATVSYKSDASISETGIRVKSLNDSTWSYSKSNELSGIATVEFSTPSHNIYLVQTYMKDLDNQEYLGDLVHYLNPPFPGNGTPDKPFIISSLSDLRFVSQNYYLWTYNFIQANDIIASNTRHWNAGPNDSNMGFSPIGNGKTVFSGSFNGNGFQIDSLYINRPAQFYVGLFGHVSYGELRNITLTNLLVDGYYYCGSIVGSAGYNSIINSCHADGDIHGHISAGGIAGCLDNSSRLSNCTSLINVRGDDKTGGLVGDIYSSRITKSYATGDISGNTMAGGLVGYVKNSEVTLSYFTGSVTGSKYIGGLTGESSETSDITNSYSTGYVKGGSLCGGLVGLNFKNSKISNCYSTGNVAGTSTTGKFLGYNDKACPINTCYFDKETSGEHADSIGMDWSHATVTGLSTEEFSSTESFPGFDFDSVNWINEPDGRPYLFWQPVHISNNKIHMNHLIGRCSSNSEDIAECGYRYKKINDTNWSFRKVNDHGGTIDVIVNNLERNKEYYIQTYALTSDSIMHFGDAVKYLFEKNLPNITWPEAQEVNFGDSLSNDILFGGYSDIPGIFKFIKTDTMPQIGVGYYAVIFIPDDSLSSYSVENVIPVIVLPPGNIEPASITAFKFETSTNATFQKSHFPNLINRRPDQNYFKHILPEFNTACTLPIGYRERFLWLDCNNYCNHTL